MTKFGFSLAKSILRESELCIPPPGIFRGYPPRSYLSRDRARSSYLFWSIDLAKLNPNCHFFYSNCL